MYSTFDIYGILGGTNTVHPDIYAIVTAADAPGGGWSAQGILESNISIGGSTNFNSVVDSELSTVLNKGLDMGLTAWNRWTGASVQQTQVKNIAATMASWTGSAPLSLTIRMLFIAMKKGQDIVGTTSQFYSLIYPTFGYGGSQGGPYADFLTSGPGGSQNANKPTIVTAPNGYARGDSWNPSGTVSLRVGRWLKISRLLVPTAVAIEYSKEILSSGKPLFARVTISFMTCRIVSSTEVRGFFPPSFVPADFYQENLLNGKAVNVNGLSTNSVGL